MIVAFGHKSRVGKDTASSLLLTILRQNNKNVVRASFAHELKIVAHNLYFWAGVQRPEYYDKNPAAREIVLEELGMNVRELWIKIGMAIRSVYSDTWVRHVCERYKAADYIIISDLRFVNELACLKERDKCIAVKIERDAAPVLDSPADKALDNFEDWDYILRNNGSIDELYSNILALSREIL